MRRLTTRGLVALTVVAMMCGLHGEAHARDFTFTIVAKTGDTIGGQTLATVGPARLKPRAMGDGFVVAVQE